MMRRCCSLPTSLPDRGAISPTRLRLERNDRLSATGSPKTPARAATTSPSRRSMVPALLGLIAIAAPATSNETNRKPRSGSRIVTLYLDLDDLTDPEVADG